ncbi:hypothetical protein K438DRAFT_2101908 [Mycena galopus ATCC 62051]|nr:hypothetical protein K438DRAFT_2101908 [Mycena galopus ATCC 62051]
MATVASQFPPNAVNEYIPHFPGYFGEHAPGTLQLDGGGGLSGLHKWHPYYRGGFSGVPRTPALHAGPSVSAPAASSKATARRANCLVPRSTFHDPGVLKHLRAHFVRLTRLPATLAVSAPAASSAICGPSGRHRVLTASAHAAPGLSDQHVREREAKLLQALAGGGGISDHSLGMLTGRCRRCKNHFLPSRLAEHELACRVILLD